MGLGETTIVVVGGGYWGSGVTLDAAKRKFRSMGGRLSDGYGIMEFDEATEFFGIDNYGRYEYKGNAPTITTVKARTAATR